MTQLSKLPIVRSLARLQCTSCGAEANASCNCGKPYVPKEVAREAIIADPSKSNRTIAKETGASLGTVNTVRKELTEQGCSVDAPRVGLDGKVRRTRTESQIAATEARKEKRHELNGWPGFENRVYTALELLRNEMPDVLSDIEKISEVIKAALRRSIETEEEEAAE